MKTFYGFNENVKQSSLKTKYGRHRCCLVLKNVESKMSEKYKHIIQEITKYGIRTNDCIKRIAYIATEDGILIIPIITDVYSHKIVE
ncbi:MAG: hypothetical protein ACRC13_12190 [Tannerellaceae bacterium]